MIWFIYSFLEELKFSLLNILFLEAQWKTWLISASRLLVSSDDGMVVLILMSSTKDDTQLNCVTISAMYNYQEQWASKLSTTGARAVKNGGSGFHMANFSTSLGSVSYRSCPNFPLIPLWTFYMLFFMVRFAKGFHEVCVNNIGILFPQQLLSSERSLHTEKHILWFSPMSPLLPTHILLFTSILVTYIFAPPTLPCTYFLLFFSTVFYSCSSVCDQASITWQGVWCCRSVCAYCILCILADLE